MVALPTTPEIVLRGPLGELYGWMYNDEWDKIPHESMYWGAAGTGKSFAMLVILVLLLTDPRRGGVRVLWCRHTRRSITNSSLVTLMKVFDLLGIKWPSNQLLKDIQELKFTTPAGVNVLVFTGLDTPSRAYSAEHDIVVFEELQEIGEAAYELAAARSLRNWKLPNQFIVSLTNPTSKAGWIYRRSFVEGRMVPRQTVITDNPAMSDANGVMSERGAAYIEGLSTSYSGARKLRMLNGEWVGEEGAVLDLFDEDRHGFKGIVQFDRYRAPRIVLSEKHSILPDVIPLEWTFGSLDLGFVNPGVLLVWGVDSKGRLYLLDETYMTGMDRTWWTDVILRKAETYRCRAFVSDHDPERLAFWNDELHRRLPELTTTPDGEPYVRRCAKSMGNRDFLKVEVVRSLLDDGIDGHPRCFVNLDALSHDPDPELVAVSKAHCLNMEIPALVWKPVPEAMVDDRLPDEVLHPRCANHAFDAWVYAGRFHRANRLSKNWSAGRPQFGVGTLEAHIDHMENKWKTG